MRYVIAELSQLNSGTGLRMRLTCKVDKWLETEIKSCNYSITELEYGIIEWKIEWETECTKL